MADEVTTTIRIGERKFRNYADADSARGLKPAGQTPADKIKIFARNDGTFDVVWYKKVKSEVKKK